MKQRVSFLISLSILLVHFACPKSVSARMLIEGFPDRSLVGFILLSVAVSGFLRLGKFPNFGYSFRLCSHDADTIWTRQKYYDTTILARVHAITA